MSDHVVSMHHDADRPRATVRPMRREDHEHVLALARQLHGWFNEDACERAIPIDLRHQKGLVAELAGQIAGFIMLYVVEGRLHIGWLGVRRDLHRRGIGRLLIAGAEAEARALGIGELAVYTLGESVDYPPYVPTRQFYLAMGFRPFRRKQTDDQGCPEELHLIKCVAVRS